MDDWTVKTMAVFLVGMLLMGCAPRTQTGALPGTAVGGAIGEMIDDDGEEGLIIGAIAGGRPGYAIGDYMDRRDRRRMERALEKKSDEETATRTNSETGRSFALTPPETFKNEDGVPCRAFTLEIDFE